MSSLATSALQLGPFGSPPAILVTLVAIALVLLVGKFVLKLAWKLVVIGIIIVAGLWLLGALGFSLNLL